MVFEEALHFGPQVCFGGPGLGNHHRQRMRQAASGHYQQFEGVVKTGGVRTPLDNDRVEIGNTVSQLKMSKQGRPGAHAVDVAAQGIDLAVVGNVAKRLGQIPGRKGVGAVALVDKSDGADDTLIIKLGVIGIQLLREQHPLVENDATGERTDIEHLLAGQFIVANGILCPLARQVEHQVETRGFNVAAADKYLHDLRLHGPGIATDGFVIRPYLAPAENLAADA